MSRTVTYNVFRRERFADVFIGAFQVDEDAVKRIEDDDGTRYLWLRAY